MYAKRIKRLLDFTLSLIAVTLLSPLLLVLTGVGAILMRGNPFFIQKRVGWHEKVFYLIKFRTMTNERGLDGALLPDGERMNRYGKFLRSTSLDETPELFNIITGDMSIVGPRPLLVRYLPRYSAKQRRRHEARPGLTGYAQVHGRNAASWEEKFKMDVWYVDHVSLKTDLKIIRDTVKTVLSREGINSPTSATMEEFMGDMADE